MSSRKNSEHLLPEHWTPSGKTTGQMYQLGRVTNYWWNLKSPFPLDKYVFDSLFSKRINVILNHFHYALRKPVGMQFMHKWRL